MLTCQIFMYVVVLSDLYVDMLTCHLFICLKINKNSNKVDLADHDVDIRKLCLLIRN